jgi:hypothetical protein
MKRCDRDLHKRDLNFIILYRDMHKNDVNCISLKSTPNPNLNLNPSLRVLSRLS